MCIRYLRQRTPECPEQYPDLLAVAEGFDDTRSCTPCACEELEDATCSALVSVYEDGGCRELLGAEMVTMAGPKCVAGPDLRLGEHGCPMDQGRPRQMRPDRRSRRGPGDTGGPGLLLLPVSRGHPYLLMTPPAKGCSSCSTRTPL